MDSLDTRCRRVGLPIILAACVMVIGIVTLLTGTAQEHRTRFLAGLVITGVGVIMGVAVIVLGTNCANTTRSGK